ncbi:MAG: diacylglycerol kinase [Bacteroidetes bacterium]|nr:diacylglycerol kinase [Bacteroidota bacterium]
MPSQEHPPSYFLILNPGSKGGKSRKKINSILSAFSSEKVDFGYVYTKSLQDAAVLSAEANRKGYDIIIAVGGDGTINRVLNGFYDTSGKRISNAVLGLIYTGTSPDFCKTYNIPLKTGEAVNTVFQKYTRAIPVGKITLCKNERHEYKDFNFSQVPPDETETNFFACCVNLGLGPEIARFANSGVRKYLGDYTGTFFSLIKALLRYKPTTFNISDDRGEREVTKLVNLSAGLTRYIASGIKVEHDLEENDDRFYVMSVRDLSWRKLPFVLRTIYSGRKIINNNEISLDYSTSLTVHGNINAGIEFDGDPWGFLPCSVELAPDRLEVLCRP